MGAIRPQVRRTKLKHKNIHLKGFWGLLTVFFLHNSFN